MDRKVRKLLLTAHITVSVGWIGAVLAYLALVIAAMMGQRDQLLRTAWIALEAIGWYVIVPLALSALVTGITISLATPWGLFRHYWVVISWHLTLVAVAVLLQHMSAVVTPVAAIAADSAITNVRDVSYSALRGELLHAGVGLVILLGITTLNVCRPRGLTPFGREVPEKRPRWARLVWIHAAAWLLLLQIIAHVVAGGGLRLHG
ncbi:MAG TPA: hypothetical protein VNL98_07275 [Gemmatimonadales bacterium]|nr:hypothetical protein [Gemmatimonadales bacterium]